MALIAHLISAIVHLWLRSYYLSNFVGKSCQMKMTIKLCKTYSSPALVKNNFLVLQFMHNRLRDCYMPIYFYLLLMPAAISTLQVT